MGLLSITQPLPIAAVAATRGTGADNLRTRDPKEVWIDSAVGSGAGLTIDLGTVRTIDTIWLGYVSAAADATWAVNAGIANANEAIVQAPDVLRVPDVAGHFAPVSHALWQGTVIAARYLSIAVTQPAGAAPMSIGVPVMGHSFVADLGPEWGSGRRPIDTGTKTPLPGGGFAVVEGAHKRAFGWTFGDLTVEETERLELIADALGETAPGLVIEDATRTAGLRSRMHYGLFERWRVYERRNRKQTRWEIGIEEWV